MHVERDVLAPCTGFLNNLDAAHASLVIAPRDQVTDLKLNLGIARDANDFLDCLRRTILPVARVRREELAGPPGLARKRRQFLFG